MIVDIAMLKDEIGRTDSDHDAMIARKLADAEAIIIDYLKVAADEYENVDGDNDFPQIVGAAVLLVAKSLFEQPEVDPLTTAVKNILRRLRDPALA